MFAKSSFCFKKNRAFQRATGGRRWWCELSSHVLHFFHYSTQSEIKMFREFDFVKYMETSPTMPSVDLHLISLCLGWANDDKIAHSLSEGVFAEDSIEAGECQDDFFLISTRPVQHIMR